MVAELLPHFQKVRSIKVALTAGNRNRAGASTIASILSYVGRPVRVWENGRWRERAGWAMGEHAEFPQPVGRRRVQLCDVPDLELFPGLFGAENVIFKAGVELAALNYAIGALGQVRRSVPSLNLPAVARPLVAFSRLFNRLGTFRGSVAVWVTGDDGKAMSLALVAPCNGPRVPAAAAVLLARKVLTGDIPVCGAFACAGLIGLNEFADHLAPFGIWVARGEGDRWLT
jgi:hypothetical protein